MSTKVLIVEDEEGIANAFKKQLELIGDFEVTISDGGESGLKNIKSTQYGVILLDLVMPDIDGIAILDELKTKPKEYNLAPIIVLTNVTSEDIKKKVMSYGVKEMLVKTDIHPKELIAKIKKLVK